MEKKRKRLKTLSFVILFIVVGYAVFNLLASAALSRMVIVGSEDEIKSQAIDNLSDGKKIIVTNGDMGISQLSRMQLGPEFFNLSGRVLVVNSDYKFIFPYDKTIYIFSNIYDNEAAINDTINDIVNIIIEAGDLENLSEYEKVLWVHDILKAYLQYENGVAQDLYSVLTTGKTMCLGYSRAFAYVLNQIGIEARVVCGTVDSNGHAWTLVYIDNEPYYFDLTYNDAVYYDWFAVTKEELQKTHTPTFETDWVDTTENKYNYYVYHDMYLTEFSENLVVNQIKTQGKSIHIKCANEEIRKSLVELLNDKDFQARVSEELEIGPICDVKIYANEPVNIVHCKFVCENDNNTTK